MVKAQQAAREAACPTRLPWYEQLAAIAARVEHLLTAPRVGSPRLEAERHAEELRKIARLAMQAALKADDGCPE